MTAASLATSPAAVSQSRALMMAHARADEGEALPRSFGKYLLFDHIGRGGMADIYLASARTELGAERLVVVKQILPELGGDAGFARMLVAEAKLAAQLNHANVVQVIDLGREQDRLFITMEYVEGFDLNQLLRRLSKSRVGLPAEFAILIVREVLRALDYAHRARTPDGRPLEIVHRDVSPSNVLISFEGEVKLCDFGIAKAYGLGDDGAPDEGRIARARVAGKSAYMAPEHAAGEMIDARADVFAAAILLWELCAGRRLYKGTEQEMLDQARAGDVPALPSRGLPMPAKLQAILDRAFEVDRLRRWQRAADLLAALESYAMSAGLMASQLRFGQFLTDHFADEIVHVRRARELSAKGELPPRVEPEPVAAADGSSVRARSDVSASPRRVDVVADEPELSSAPDQAPAIVADEPTDPIGHLAPDEPAGSVAADDTQPLPIANEEPSSRWWPWIALAAFASGAVVTAAWLLST